MPWDTKFKPDKHPKHTFYAINFSRDRIGITTKQSWNDLDPYGDLPNANSRRPLWKQQLYQHRGVLGRKRNKELFNRESQIYVQQT